MSQKSQLIGRAQVFPGIFVMLNVVCYTAIVDTKAVLLEVSPDVVQSANL